MVKKGVKGIKASCVIDGRTHWATGADTKKAWDNLAKLLSGRFNLFKPAIREKVDTALKEVDYKVTTI